MRRSEKAVTVKMPFIRAFSKVAKQALLSPGCGCQPITVAVRTISFSPRQVTSDASFHSVSFSETDHPKVLITGKTNPMNHSIRETSSPGGGIPVTTYHNRIYSKLCEETNLSLTTLQLAVFCGTNLNNTISLSEEDELCLTEH
ncbi:unnamed protein product [Oncorhynchus mykiss]|uniref:Uncharacterized protein n=1 Tax=Oncorhynchus mykiss TaxID=8022 RepID=A0A060YQV7_ONCMY|nr:unnamed protein product [Oncorhynchus mykiss]